MERVFDNKVAIKITVIALSTIAGLLLTMTPAISAPMYYTFEGSITKIEDPNGSINTQVAIGDSVEQVWIVDLDADGYRTQNDGDISSDVDTADFDYFYTDYFSGLTLSLPGAGDFDGPNDIAEYNSSYTYSPGPHTNLIGESANERIWLVNYTGGPITGWFAGMSGFESYQTFSLSGTETLDRWWSEDMTLTSITEVPSGPDPVPEPSTILLLGSGLVGLAWYGRKREKV